jgi:ankyrin repeat protein
MELLIQAGALVECKDLREQTPLHIAAANDDLEATGLLLSYKANPNARDCDGRTPLHRTVTKSTRTRLVHISEGGC